MDTAVIEDVRTGDRGEVCSAETGAKRLLERSFEGGGASSAFGVFPRRAGGEQHWRLAHRHPVGEAENGWSLAIDLAADVNRI